MPVAITGMANLAVKVADLDAAWGTVATTVVAGTLETAVRLAKEQARVGQRVLLSPGCASFDQYQGFERRGEHFRRLVRAAHDTREMS